MLMLFLAAAVVDAPSDMGARASARGQATATVTIVRGAEIRFGGAMHFEESVMRESTVRERDGSVRTASLIEFY